MPTEGSEHGDIVVGGTVSGRRPLVLTNPASQTDLGLRAVFLFPIQQGLDVVVDLLQIAVDVLGAEYGYYFVRDDSCLPSGYSSGVSPVLDMSRLSDLEAQEISGWSKFVREGLWSGPLPCLRDLFEVNLISDRHTVAPVDGLGYLHEWIEAAPGRGRLKSLGRGRRLWALTDEELVNVRPILNDAGLLLSCNERLYRDLPGAEEVRRRLFYQQRIRATGILAPP
jgi:hypothetical protein